MNPKKELLWGLRVCWGTVGNSHMIGSAMYGVALVATATAWRVGGLSK